MPYSRPCPCLVSGGTGMTDCARRRRHGPEMFPPEIIDSRLRFDIQQIGFYLYGLVEFPPLFTIIPLHLFRIHTADGVLLRVHPAVSSANHTNADTAGSVGRCMSPGDTVGV